MSIEPVMKLYYQLAHHIYRIILTLAVFFLFLFCLTDFINVFVLKEAIQKVMARLILHQVVGGKKNRWEKHGIKLSSLICSYSKRFLLTPIQKLTISIQDLALCPNTNYVRI